jgi:hypothetical protein
MKSGSILISWPIPKEAAASFLATRVRSKVSKVSKCHFEIDTPVRRSCRRIPRKERFIGDYPCARSTIRRLLFAQILVERGVQKFPASDHNLFSTELLRFLQQQSCFVALGREQIRVEASRLCRSPVLAPGFHERHQLECAFHLRTRYDPELLPNLEIDRH